MSAARLPCALFSSDFAFTPSALMSTAACTAAACSSASCAMPGDLPLVIGEPGSLLSLLLDEQRRMTVTAAASPTAVALGDARTDGGSSGDGPTAVDVFSRLHDRH